MRLERALTHFGETALEIVSQVATGQIVVKLEPPRRNPPQRIRLRVRHPQRKAIQIPPTVLRDCLVACFGTDIRIHSLKWSTPQ